MSPKWSVTQIQLCQMIGTKIWMVSLLIASSTLQPLGEWEAPLIPNSACESAPGCGPWEPPMINNPDYKVKIQVFRRFNQPSRVNGSQK